MSKIKISIVGACITRDNFNSRFNSDYKEWFECISLQNQSSFISLMSEPVKISEEDMGENYGKARRDTIVADFNKKYLKEIIKNKPDYIIIDLYSDVRYGIIKYKGSYITNNPDKVQKTNMYMKNKSLFEQNKLHILNNKEYKEMFFEAFDRFYKYVKENLPNTKIILNKATYAYYYVDENNVVNLFSNKWSFIDKQIEVWNELNNIIASKYNIEVIDMSSDIYMGDKNHLWKCSPYHYENKFYRDFLNRLVKICLKDMLLDSKIN